VQRLRLAEWRPLAVSELPANASPRCCQGRSPEYDARGVSSRNSDETPFRDVYGPRTSGAGKFSELRRNATETLMCSMYGQLAAGNAQSRPAGTLPERTSVLLRPCWRRDRPRNCRRIYSCGHRGNARTACRNASSVSWQRIWVCWQPWPSATCRVGAPPPFASAVEPAPGRNRTSKHGLLGRTALRLTSQRADNHHGETGGHLAGAIASTNPTTARSGQSFCC